MDLGEIISGKYDSREGQVEYCPVCKCVETEYKRVECGDFSFVAPCHIGCRCTGSTTQPNPKNELREKITRAGIPERFANAEITVQALDGIGSAYIYGGMGVGKTHNACALGIQALKEGTSVLFTDMRKIQSMEFERIEYESRLASVGLLIIDDIGKNETSEWATSLLYGVVNARYNSRRPMVITSNYSLPKLVDALAKKNSITAAATVSRISDMCVPIQMTGGDRRGRLEATRT